MFEKWKKSPYDQGVLHDNIIMQVTAGITNDGIPTLKIMYADNEIDKVRYSEENVLKIEQKGFSRRNIQYMLVGTSFTNVDYEKLEEQGLSYDDIDYLMRKWRFEKHIGYSIKDIDFPGLDQVLKIQKEKQENDIPIENNNKVAQQGMGENQETAAPVQDDENLVVEKGKKIHFPRLPIKISTKLKIFACAIGALYGAYVLSKDSDVFKSENYSVETYTTDSTLADTSLDLEQQIENVNHSAGIYYTPVTNLDSLDSLASNWISDTNVDLFVSTVSDVTYLLNYASASTQQYYVNKYSDRDIFQSLQSFSTILSMNATNGNYLNFSSLTQDDSCKKMLDDYYQSFVSIEKAKDSDMSLFKTKAEEFLSTYIVDYYQAVENGDFSKQVILKCYLSNVYDMNTYDLDFDAILSSIQSKVSVHEHYNDYFEDVSSSLNGLKELPRNYSK